MTAIVLDEVRTRRLPNKTVGRYRYINLFGGVNKK